MAPSKVAAEKSPCRGTCKNGKPCTNSATQVNGYCALHSPQTASSPCHGTCKTGKPCTNSATQGNGYCALHSPQVTSSAPPRGTNGKEKRMEEGGKAPACRPMCGLLPAEGVRHIEDIAKGYGSGWRSGNILLIAEKGRLAADRATLLSKVPDKPGNYMWTVRPPGGRRFVPVYLGKAGGGQYKETLRGRFGAYIQKDFFGPVRESALKCKAMVDLLCRGFRIEIRFRTGVHDAIAAEDATLSKYDFPLNDKNNGGRKGVRWPIAFGSKEKKLPSHFNVINQELWQRICGTEQLPWFAAEG